MYCNCNCSCSPDKIRNKFKWYYVVWFDTLYIEYRIFYVICADYNRKVYYCTIELNCIPFFTQTKDVEIFSFHLVSSIIIAQLHCIVLYIHWQWSPGFYHCASMHCTWRHVSWMNISLHYKTVYNKSKIFWKNYGA